MANLADILNKDVEILQTNIVSTPQDAEKGARFFAMHLSVEKGVPSEVRPYFGGWLVVADDSRGILFRNAGRQTCKNTLAKDLRG